MTAFGRCVCVLMLAVTSASATPVAAPVIDLSLTESSTSTKTAIGDKHTTVITLHERALSVHEHVERSDSLGPPAPPDRDRQRTLEADELAKVRALLAESQLLAHGNVDAGAPRGCGGVEYRLALSVAIDGKRQKRTVRGPTEEGCRKPFPRFMSSQAWAGARHLVEGLKTLAGP